MNRTELREKLLEQVSDQEWKYLLTEDPAIHISPFNREVMLRMRRTKCSKGEADVEMLRKLHHGLALYLEKYMPDDRPAHKWIILSCLYLTAVEKSPMHPRHAAGWEERDGEYCCPSYDPEEGSLCHYCACRPADRK